MLKEYLQKVNPERFEKEKQYIQDNRNHMEQCPYCNGSIKDRKIAIYKGLINALYRVYKYCGEKDTHIFETKDVKHLMGKNEYNRFGDLVRFGGIIYKPKVNGVSRKGLFGINMPRAKEFFIGRSELPIQIIINQITGETIEVLSKGYVNEFPELISFIKQDGLYDYEKPVQTSLI